MKKLAICLLIAVGVGLLQPVDIKAQSGPMIRLDLQGQEIEGLPLAWTSSFAALLAPDGRLWQFSPSNAANLRKTTLAFHGYTASKMTSELRREFDSRFQITSTGHYLVVHPTGRGAEWSGRFEDLYRSFKHYFQVRGFRLSEPEFPLVAIVFSTQEDFLRYAHRTGDTPRPGSPGYYSLSSNRVAMYDFTGAAGSAEWYQTGQLVIHEATHQTAYNTGIHNRFTQTPSWITEGLGTLFEAEGVWNARHSGNAVVRVNREQLSRFRAYLSKRPADALPQMISSDRIFSEDAWSAYAEAWALTYYLVETQPRRYAQYLRKTAERPDFTAYPSAQRLADFTSVFGENLRLFDAQFLRYMSSVR